MAVFPDRIILKNSTDTQAEIEAAIGTGGVDAIAQGEIVLGIEPSNARFYTKAGDGSIVSLGQADSEGLRNVVEDTTPQLGGNLDVNGYWIYSEPSENIVIDPGDNGKFIVRGNNQSASLTLNCSANSHGVTIQSPPHSAGATYTLTLPEEVGSDGYLLSGNGSGALSWVDPLSIGGGGGGAKYLGDLLDVSVNPPTSGTWTGTWVVWTTLANQQTFNSGDIGPASNDEVNLFEEDISGQNLSAQIEGLALNTVYWRKNGEPWESGYCSAFRTFNQTQIPKIPGLSASLATAEVGDVYTISDGPPTTTPDDGTVLTWVDANARWEPVAPSGGGGGIEEAPQDGTPYARQDAGWVPVSAAPGGNGGGGAAGSYLTETQTASGGAATFTDIGHSGTLQKITSSLDAWIVIYGSAADRTADAGRAYAADPAPGSGVLAELYVAAGDTVLATPGTSYFNNDTTSQDAIYVAVRDQSGASVDSEVTIYAYGQVTIDSVNGGTFGSG